MESPSQFLKLPSELRVRIYELVLTFSRPIKLRQTVAGSGCTTLLRVNRQIYEESLAVLFDVNTIAVTRNDFCTNTDAALKTPIPSQHVRHLLVTSFGESIACNFGTHCGGCKASASGFLAVLRAMPRLKSILVDYATARSRFNAFQMSCGSAKLPYTSFGVHTLRHDAFHDVAFTFHCGLIGRMWPALSALPTWPITNEVEEGKVLAKLRKLDTEMPDKLWLAVWSRSCPFVEDYPSWLRAQVPPRADRQRLFKQIETFHRQTSKTFASNKLVDSIFALELHDMLDLWTAESCRVVLGALRTQPSMQEAAQVGVEPMENRVL